jgi:RNA polymerase sigma factor (sigma-70 family)
MRDDPSVILLVTRARAGDQQAWNALVERYAPLLWSICCRYGLGSADAGDASQNVWLALVDQLGNIRDPAALPGWLATITRRECNRVLRARSAPAAVAVLDAENIPGEQTEVAEQRLLTAERHAALREAFTDLPPACQRLIAMLIKDPRCPTPRSAPSWASPSAASAPSAAAAWRSCAVTPPSLPWPIPNQMSARSRTVRAYQRCYEQRSADHQHWAPYPDNLRAVT